jgi:hypothetical protein
MNHTYEGPILSSYETHYYKYEADHHCVDCTTRRMRRRDGFKCLTEFTKEDKRDDYDLYVLECADSVFDNDGDLVYPCYQSDEWHMPDPEWDGDIQFDEILQCGTCLKTIATYDHGQELTTWKQGR